MVAVAAYAICFTGQPNVANAALVTAAATSAINLGTTWSDSNPPASGNSYEIGGSFTVNVPNALSPYTFPGDAMRVASTGTLRLDSTVTGRSYSFPNFKMAGGTLFFNTSSATSSWTVPSSIEFETSTASTLTMNTANFTHIANLSGAITGGGNVSVNVGGNNRNNFYINTADNTHSGDWTVTGTVAPHTNGYYGVWVKAKNALGSGDVTLGSFGVLKVDASQGLNSVAGVTLNSSTSGLYLARRDTGETEVFDNAWTNASAYLAANDGFVYVGNGDGANDTSIGNLSGTGANAEIQGVGTAASLTVNQTTDATYAGSLTQTTGNTLAFTKNGSAKLTLTGTGSTYSGGTTIGNGTLLANNASGSATGTGSVIVNGGTFGGTGSVTGAVIVNSTGTLSPGGSVESLASGDLTMGSGSTFKFEALNNTSTGADLMVVGGSLVLTGVTLDLSAANLNSGSWVLGDKLTLISYENTAITSGFTGYTNNGIYTFGANQWQIAYDDLAPGTNYASEALGDQFVTLTMVPEPGSFGMLLFGAVMLWAVCRKHS